MTTTTERLCSICSVPLVRRPGEAMSFFHRRKTCGGDCLRALRIQNSSKRGAGASGWRTHGDATMQVKRERLPPMEGCVHHWRLAAQARGMSEVPAVCLKCGGERTYPAEAQDTLYAKYRTYGFGHSKDADATE